MKKFLAITAIIILLLGAIGWFVFRSLGMEMPEGESGDKAEEITDKMLASLNYEGFKQLEEISWTFRDKNKYIWNKKARTVLAEFDDAIVKLDFATDQHKIIKPNTLPEDELIQTAISNFYNDSFWMAAPFKIRAKSATRKYVETEDGPGILVTYGAGGVTPGDSYLWVLDENYRPKYWRFWTQIVSLQGMKFKWKGWTQKEGVWFSTKHKAQVPVSVNISDLEVK